MLFVGRKPDRHVIPSEGGHTVAERFFGVWLGVLDELP